MSDCLKEKTVKTRKAHRCFGCGRLFPPGSKMRQSTIAEDGTVWECYLCDTCQEIESHLEPCDTYSEGDFYYEALELEEEK